MAFKKRAARPPVPTSPKALYPLLSHGAEAPRELWSRQADVLRAYEALKDKTGQFPADVAIELPTGAGKTLVGCLIAEWRRRAVVVVFQAFRRRGNPAIAVLDVRVGVRALPDLRRRRGPRRRAPGRDRHLL